MCITFFLLIFIGCCTLFYNHASSSVWGIVLLTFLMIWQKLINGFSFSLVLAWGVLGVVGFFMIPFVRQKLITHSIFK